MPYRSHDIDFCTNADLKASFEDVVAAMYFHIAKEAVLVHPSLSHSFAGTPLSVPFFRI